jgi:predicted O-methyltransferase YrrM
MIKNIRPRIIFELAEKKIKAIYRNINIDIPPSYIGSLTLLETSILLTFVKCIKAKKIFEFGTYFGGTTKNLANNCDLNTKIYSLDIDSNKMKIDNSKLNLKNKNYLKNEKINDHYLMKLFKENGAFKIKELNRSNQKKIELINLDSSNFDGLKFKKKFDLIFIDGGHDLKTIQSDTINSNIMSKKDSIIVWHDYNSKIHKSVTKFIKNYSKKKKIFFVENTMLAIQLNGKYKKIIK